MNPQAIYDKFADEWSDIQSHLKRLRESAKDNVFEIGVRAGVSTAALLMGVHDHGGHVWSLDVDDCAALFRDDPNWTFLRGHSVQDAPRILSELPEHLALLFIDADHTFENTKRELELYAPRVAPGGMILMHDTDLQWAGVRRALDEYAAQLGRMATYYGGSYGMGALSL